MILGYLLAALGAFGSGLGSVLESIGIRRAGAYGGDAGDLRLIPRQPVYWTGVTIDIASFVCAAAALHRLPLFLVQSVMSLSVGVTATISVLLGIRLGRRGWMALALAGVGLVLLGISAEPGPAQALPPGWRWVLLGMFLPIIGIALYSQRIKDRYAAPLLGFAAGLGFAAVAVSARTLPPLNGFADLLGEPAAWAIAVNGVTATAVFAMALQNGTATTVSAVMFTTNTVVPSGIGLGLLNDSIRIGFLVPAIIGFLMAVAGSVAVAHYSEMATEQLQREDLAVAVAT